MHLHFLITKDASVPFKHPYSYANITVNNIHTRSQMGSLVVPPSIATWLRNMLFCQEYQQAQIYLLLLPWEDCLASLFKVLKH